MAVAQLCYIADACQSESRMSTTTVRIEPVLRQRIARAAEREGKTAHAFIVEAVAERTAQAEAREQFFSEAERRYAKFLAGGESLEWASVRARVLAKAASTPLAGKVEASKKPASRRPAR